VSSLPLYVDSHVGLGDQVYMRPFVLALAKEREVYLATAWPELYWDHPEVKCVPADKGLRTQMSNIGRQRPEVWSRLPRDVERIRPSYSGELKRGDLNVYAALEVAFGVTPEPFRWVPSPVAFADAQAWLDQSGWDGRPMAIVRPSTVRREWDVYTRNPKEGYLPRLVEAHPEFRWLAVGHVLEGHEDLVDPGPHGDLAALQGELRWDVLAALMYLSEVVLTGPCFMLPLGMALGAKLFVVYGGYARPESMVDPRMGTYDFAAPVPVCHCVRHEHDCEKDIPNLAEEFSACLRPAT